MLLYANWRLIIASWMAYFPERGKRLLGGKLNNSDIDFITSSIKVTFTKWHLSLQTLIQRSHMQKTKFQHLNTIYHTFILWYKINLTGLFLLLNLSRPNTPVVPALGAVPSHKELLSHSGMKSSEVRVCGWLQALTVWWEMKTTP